MCGDHGDARALTVGENPLVNPVGVRVSCGNAGFDPGTPPVSLCGMRVQPEKERERAATRDRRVAAVGPFCQPDRVGGERVRKVCAGIVI